MSELISVVMPVFHGRAHIEEAIRSIRSQTYKNWELLVIHEYGSNDGSAELVCQIAKVDPRVKLVQNESCLGLAESLNRGIRMAKGGYIARMDADDLSHPQRFEKQVRFLGRHPHISLCGTWQHHFGPNREWVHQTAVSPQACRANLLFSCDMCHSTVMFRRKDFVDRGLFYHPAYLAEDFELWSRAVGVLEFSNIPQVLGEYRWDGDNITAQKMGKLAKEHAGIVAASLQRNLGLAVCEEEKKLLEGWGNPFFAQRNRKVRRQMYQDLETLLRKIWKRNEEVYFYEAQALLRVLYAQWRYAKYREPRNQNQRRAVGCLEDIFTKKRYPDYGLLWREYQSRSVSPGADLKRLVKYLRAGRGNDEW